jgi:hypothetical protein
MARLIINDFHHLSVEDQQEIQDFIVGITTEFEVEEDQIQLPPRNATRRMTSWADMGARNKK